LPGADEGKPSLRQPGETVVRRANPKGAIRLGVQTTDQVTTQTISLPELFQHTLS